MSIFVSSEISTLADGIKTPLEEWSSSSGRPLRVLFGRFRTVTVPDWTSEEAEACGVDLEVCRATGVTIFSWGAASQIYGREWESLPACLYQDNTARTLVVKDVIVPQEDAVRRALDYIVGPEDGENFRVAEYAENAVWFFFNLEYLPDPELLDWDTVLIEPLRRCIDSEVLRNFREELDEQSAEAFANLMASSPEDRVSTQRQSIDANERQLREWESAILRTERQLQMQRAELDAIMNSITVDPEHWKDQWRAISRHPMINAGSLTMVGQTVQFETILLNITDQNSGSELPLGRMRITINMQTGEVKIENLNNRRRDRDHPHVQSGEPCWGGYASEVRDLLRRNELAGFVEFIFGYLQTYNPDDEWGRYFSYWRDQPELVGA